MQLHGLVHVLLISVVSAGSIQRDDMKVPEHDAVGDVGHDLSGRLPSCAGNCATALRQCFRDNCNGVRNYSTPYSVLISVLIQTYRS